MNLNLSGVKRDPCQKLQATLIIRVLLGVLLHLADDEIGGLAQYRPLVRLPLQRVVRRHHRAQFIEEGDNLDAA